MTEAAPKPAEMLDATPDSVTTFTPTDGRHTWWIEPPANVPTTTGGPVIPGMRVIPTGWICPVCGRGCAPWLSTCPCTPTTKS